MDTGSREGLREENALSYGRSISSDPIRTDVPGVGMTAGQGNNHENKARPGQRRIAQWTRDYTRLPGIPDEYIGPDGAPRLVWSRFFDAFAALSSAEIERRFAAADRHLREAGVTY